MPHAPRHAESTRRRLLERGGSHAKRHGFAASGMDALAAAAGVTTGAVYKHFAGKTDLFAAVVADELARSAGRFSEHAARGPETVAAALAAYLSPAHVGHPAQGCMLPALTSEVGRAPAPVRGAFQHGVEDIVAIFERLTGSRERAWALLAQVVGGVMIARAVRDETVRDEVLAAVRTSIGTPPAPPRSTRRKTTHASVRRRP